MVKRTTIAIDDQLLARAKRSLGTGTIRATVEEALRGAATQVENDREERLGHRAPYFEMLAERADLEALTSDRMWQ